MQSFMAHPIQISRDYFNIFFICWSTFLDFQIAMDFPYIYKYSLDVFIYICGNKYIFVGVSWMRAKNLLLYVGKEEAEDEKYKQNEWVYTVYKD